MESLIEDCRHVDGTKIAHSGRMEISLFRFGETIYGHVRMQMEEIYSIEEAAVGEMKAELIVNGLGGSDVGHLAANWRSQGGRAEALQGGGFSGQRSKGSGQQLLQEGLRALRDSGWRVMAAGRISAAVG
ncbi:uncharacterized protein A4U43_C10F11700 [Asparagus officinalis]|uniref:Uncharacterized protein n=1 Tax=Asparagus officinalis TaxID=4686 RepID=A0A5P1E2D1_ASPOF|nr:uncharacterized protein A4U43_C10F11700 [Asparagus officinalis]